MRPPVPFDPATAPLSAGQLLYRVQSATRTATDFNPGFGSPHPVRLLRGPGGADPVRRGDRGRGDRRDAVARRPGRGGLLPYDQYASKVLVRLELTRSLRVAVLHGTGLRRLKVTAELTSGPASDYRSTVRWAEAAHDAGFDGLVWMSRQCNDAKAYVFFGDRCAGEKDPAFVQDPSHARIFVSPADQIWLIDLCAPLHVDVLMEPS